MEHSDAVRQQFGPQAQAYLTSAVHAQGYDLDRLGALAARVAAGKVALDVGCGAGHASFAMAPHVADLIACDLSSDMLAVVDQTAASRGLTSLRTQVAPAERLPFADASFALVASRFSAHHWNNPSAALREFARVLQPDGVLCLIDILGPSGPEAALLDTHLQAVELLRDTSHVRDRSSDEWKAMLTAAGFALQEESTWRLPIHFDAWLARMRTPPVLEAAVRQLLAGAPEEFLRHYQVNASTLDFELEAGMFTARRIG